MFCPECGREIKEQSNFCPECGFHLENILPFISNKRQSISKNNPKSKAYDVMTIRQTYKKAYEKWTEAEDKELTSDFLQGLTVSQLAEKHQRKKGAISSRLTKLHLTR